MSKLKISAALLVIGAVSLAVPVNVAPATPLSAAPKSMAQESISSTCVSADGTAAGMVEGGPCGRGGRRSDRGRDRSPIL
jgi:hypothetical protein